MTKLISLTAACSLFAAPAAFALNAQTHHCEVGGAEVTKTKAQCHKAGGKWAKGAPAAAGTPVNTQATPPAATAPQGKTTTNNGTVSPPPGDRTPGN